MNEEWYNDQIHSQFMKDERWRPNYDIWLAQLVAAYETMLDDGRPEAGTRKSDMMALETIDDQLDLQNGHLPSSSLICLLCHPM